jgi:hypothetical protein
MIDLSVLDRFSAIIKDLKPQIIETGNKNICRIEVEFINKSRLSVYYSENLLNKSIKYSYHWQSTESKLIVRWDNAPHHFSIATFPYHKHIGSEENIQSSFEISLLEVLVFISENIDL